VVWLRTLAEAGSHHLVEGVYVLAAGGQKRKKTQSFSWTQTTGLRTKGKMVCENVKRLVD